MEANATKIKITPPSSKRVHDELYSRVLVIRSGASTACIINLDLLNIDKETTDKICSFLEERTNIPSSNILICCTHNHGAGLWLPPLIGGNTEYALGLVEPIAEAIVLAYGDLAPAEICIGSGRFDTPLVDNSRYLLRDKTIAYSDFTKDEIIAPTGPVDPEVGVLHVRDKRGETIGLLYNYSCHANAKEGLLKGEVRSDYPGITSDYLENKLGGTALFTPGAGGDIHPLGIWYEDDAQKRHELAHRMGQELGMVVEQAVQQMTDYQSDVVLGGTKRLVYLPMREPEEWEEEDIMRTCSREGLKNRKEPHLRQYRYVAEQLRAKKGEKVAAMIQALKIGGCVLVGIPGELFVEYGIEIKKRSSSPFTFVVTLANDDIGYMPTEIALKLGGYQTWPLWLDEYPAPSVGRTLVEESLSLIAEACGDTMKR